MYSNHAIGGVAYFGPLRHPLSRAIIGNMEARWHLSKAELGSARPILLALLRGYRPDGEGFADPKAAMLEAAADAHWFVYPDDKEVVEAWQEFYGRVVKGSGAEGA